MPQIKKHAVSINDTSVTSVDNLKIFPSFPSHQSVKQFLMKYPSAWNDFLQFPHEIQQEFLDFCIGKHGLRITYDPVFRKIFNPETHKDRLESLLSSILGRKVLILEVLPREGTRLSETGSFVIMDVLVRLDDGSYANIEMQKIGYNFSFNDLHKVYCIILMEQSPAEFHSVKNKYIHVRTASFDTGIYKNNAGLHEDVFICLDSFHSIVHNITKSSTLQDSWLTFLSSVDINEISELVRNFSMFLPIYQEIAEFAQKPEELMSMFSEALYIMDRNMERLMVEEMKEEVEAAKAKAEAVKAEAEAAKAEVDAARTEAEIFRQRLAGSSPAEIADSLCITLDEVNNVLSSVSR